MGTPPKVFISYSRDTPAHEAKVLDLADRLRKDGIDAMVDQYESFPPDGWIRWMKRQIRDAQFVLVVCTEIYCRRADGDEKAGVGLGAIFESRLIQQFLYDAAGMNQRFVPVLFAQSDREHIPLELRPYTHFPLHTEQGYMDLYRLLTNQPKVEKPMLGRALSVLVGKTDFRNLLWNVPSRNPFFTGRATHLEAIRSALTHASSVVLTQPRAISGLGGIGKTQTAIEYAHIYRANYPVVLWSVADSVDALLSGFASFANLLNLPEKDEKDFNIVARAVRRWLESNSEWLLVLDNVENLSLVHQFAPPNAAGGHLLITTRLRATGEVAEVVELKKMDPEEGALFLLRRAKLIPKDKSPEAISETDRTLARQISTEMDGLPLALDQAGAFIEEKPSALAEYLTLYRQEGKALRALRGDLATSHPSSVTITFSLAFTRVANANQAAADLVRACAFLAPDAIPEEIFTEGGQAFDQPIATVAAEPLAWVAAVGEAGKFSLIHRNPENKTLNIHRLVQEVVKDNMDDDTRRSWAERVVEAVNKVFPDPEFQNWTQCERLFPHATAAGRLVREFGLVSAAAGHLLLVCGGYLKGRGQYAEAEPFLRRSVDINTEALGAHHPETGSSFYNLASLYRQQGRYSEAEPLSRRVLDIYERALGPNDALTVNALNSLGALYNDQGRYSEAEPVLRRALESFEKVIDPTDHRFAACLNNLGFAYLKLERYSEAEPFFRRALEFKERTLGPDSPSVAITLNNLAVCCGNQGRHAEEEDLQRRALKIREKTLGPEHPETGSSLHNLGELYLKQDRDTEAEPLLRRALAIAEKALGPEHPATKNSARSYASLLRKVGRTADAEELETRFRVRDHGSLGI